MQKSSRTVQDLTASHPEFDMQIQPGEIEHQSREIDGKACRQVLCIPTNDLADIINWDVSVDGCRDTCCDMNRIFMPCRDMVNPSEKLGNLLRHQNLHFRIREEAEKNPQYKQIIPYVMLTHHESRSVFAYSRTNAATESRLHGKFSIGVGGHIDWEDFDVDAIKTFSDAVGRELHEEVGHTWAGLLPNMDSLRGFIYDGSTEVGSVHLGVVLQLKLATEAFNSLRCIDAEMKHGQILTAEEVTQDFTVDLEPWSFIARRMFDWVTPYISH